MDHSHPAPKIEVKSLITTLHPVVQQQAHKLIQKCAQEGIVLRVTQALRTYEQQNWLYAQGRTRKGPRVTNARGGYSWHNFGLAFDVVILRDGRATYKGPWKRIGEIGRNLGLEWGGDFKTFLDQPHFQNRLGMTLREARAAYKAELRAAAESAALEELEGKGMLAFSDETSSDRDRSGDEQA